MIIRVEKTTAYSVISNAGMNDQRLSFKARGVLAHLLTKPDNWEVSVQALINGGPDGRESVQSALRELRKYGYADFGPYKDSAGKLLGSRWVIYEIGKPLQPPASTAPTDGFPDERVSRQSENPHQVSTEIQISTDTLFFTAEKKKNQNSEVVFRESPPISAAPPRVTFEESVWCSESVEAFRVAMCQELGVDIDSGKSEYYRGRVQKWSHDKKSKSSNWPAMASKFFVEDSKSNQNQYSKQRKTTKYATHQTDSPDLERIKRFKSNVDGILSEFE